MKIGIPKEIKTSESRVALVPAACLELVQCGHEVIGQTGCGLLSGYPDKEYTDAGCRMVDFIQEVYAEAQLIIKVKEPQPEEYPLIKKHHSLFCYLHLAAEPELTEVLKNSGAIAIAFEEVTDAHGNLPLLKPMSMIAGKLSAQYASVYLHSHYSGRGVLMDSIANAEQAKVTVLGYGVSGTAAAEHFANMGAALTIVDKNQEKLSLAKQLSNNVTTLNAISDDIETAIINSDVVIGAVLVSGARAPIVVQEDWVKNMHKGAVIIDIAVDQGGCIATTKPTTYEEPTFILHDVVHFGVQNMPAAVPRTASQLLSNAILPAVKILAENKWRDDENIFAGLVVENGVLV